MSFSYERPRRWRALLALVVAGTLAFPQSAGAAEDAPDRGAGQRSLTVVGEAVLPETTTGVRDLAVSADGRRAVAVGGDWLQVLRLTRGNPRVTGESTAVFGGRVVLARDGRTAYVLEDTHTLFVVDLRGDRPRKVATLRKRRLAPNDVFDIEVSPNGRFLLAKYGYERGGFGGEGSGVQVLSLAKPRKPRKVSRTRVLEWHGRLAVAPGNRWVVSTSSADDDYLRIYRLSPRGRLSRRARIPVQFSPDAIAFNAAGTRAYVLSHSSEDPLRIAVVNLKRRSLVRVERIPGFEGGTDLVLSEDGRHLFVTMWRGTPADNPSFVTVDAKTLRARHYAAGEELYGPQAVQAPRSGPAAGRVLVPTYTGFTGGRPLVLVFGYE